MSIILWYSIIFITVIILLIPSYRPSGYIVDFLSAEWLSKPIRLNGYPPQ